MQLGKISPGLCSWATGHWGPLEAHPANHGGAGAAQHSPGEGLLLAPSGLRPSPCLPSPEHQGPWNHSVPIPSAIRPPSRLWGSSCPLACIRIPCGCHQPLHQPPRLWLCPALPSSLLGLPGGLHSALLPLICQPSPSWLKGPSKGKPDYSSPAQPAGHRIRPGPRRRMPCQTFLQGCTHCSVPRPPGSGPRAPHSAAFLCAFAQSAPGGWLPSSCQDSAAWSRTPELRARPGTPYHPAVPRAHPAGSALLRVSLAGLLGLGWGLTSCGSSVPGRGVGKPEVGNRVKVRGHSWHHTDDLRARCGVSWGLPEGRSSPAASPARSPA